MTVNNDILVTSEVIRYDVSMNNTDSFLATYPLLIPYLTRGTLETKRILNDHLICCKEWCAGVLTVKWTGPWSSLNKWQLCTCRFGDLLLLGIRQPKQNIPSHLAISLEDIMNNTLMWSFLNNVQNFTIIHWWLFKFACFRVMQHLLYSKYPAPYNFGPIYFV